ncbi:MAG: tetratricopeptide repeat protein [Gammaproteobacteria bacterium]|nr:tetratricopeptide repeat protein [Gammaproteobacteria bacterium]
MDDYLSEQEQWEGVKRWLKENGPWAIGGVAIAALVVAGWRWWGERKEQAMLAASSDYQTLLAAFTHNDLAGAEKQADALVAAHPGSGYADQAELAVARLEIENGQLAGAATRLAHVMQKSADPALALVARLRLARVQIEQGQADAALATLGGAEAGAFAPHYAEVRGDALLAKGDRAGALAAYREARAAGKAVDGDLLDLKINDLTRS